MKNNVLLIAPLCKEGNVDTKCIRGLLDVLAMNLQTCSNLRIKAPLFIVDIADTTDPTRIIKRDLLTWPAHFKEEELWALLRQMEIEVDKVLIPIVRGNPKKMDHLSLELRLLDAGGDYEIYYESWSGRLSEVSRGFFRCLKSILYSLEEEMTHHHEKWPQTHDEKALRLFLKAITSANFFLARIDDTDYREVLDSLFEALCIDPGLELAAYRLVGFIENLIENPSLPGEAYRYGLEILQKLERSFDLEGPVHLLIAEAYRLIDDEEGFLRNLNRALEKSPEDEEVVVTAGNYYEDRLEWNKAMAIYEDYLERPSKPSYLVFHNLGVIFAEKGDVKKAIEYWFKALKINSSYSNAYCNLMNAYFETQEYAKMWVAFEESLKHPPIYWQSYDHIVKHLGQLDDVSPLVDALQHYVEQHEDIGAYFLLGLVFKKQKKDRKALKIWKKGLQIKESNEEFVDSIGYQILSLKIDKFGKLFKRAYKDVFKGNAQKAIPFLTQCTEMVSEFWLAWFLLGKAYQRINDYPQSILAFEQARNLRADNPVILNELGLAASFSNKNDYAMDCFQKAVHLAPVNPSYLSNLALASIKMQDMGKARTAIERALAISPNDRISKNIKGIIDGRLILNPDGSLSPAKVRRKNKREKKKEK